MNPISSFKSSKESCISNLSSHFLDIAVDAPLTHSARGGLATGTKKKD